MSDIQLFRLGADGRATELQSAASDLEKPLQNLIEANLQTLLGICFLASEHATGKKHGGRIDTLGIDENHCPVIIEYKRSVGENVINQGLYYLDWLMDHRADFKLLVMDRLGIQAANAIDWSAPRLVCIAADFTKFDAHAVQQIQRNIELMRYRRFGDDLLLLELAHASSTTMPVTAPKGAKPARAEAGSMAASTDALAATRQQGPDKSYAELLPTLSLELRSVLDSLEAHVLSLGDDVQVKELRRYVAYKRIRNFACVVLQRARLLLYLHLDAPQTLPALQAVLPQARDVSAIGHWGTGDLELPLSSASDLEAVKPFIAQAYQR